MCILFQGQTYAWDDSHSPVIYAEVSAAMVSDVYRYSYSQPRPMLNEGVYTCIAIPAANVRVDRKLGERFGLVNEVENERDREDKG